MAVAGMNRSSSRVLGLACAIATYAAVVVLAGSVSSDDDARHLTDTAGDAVPRPTDPGADTPFDARAHRLIDLREITIGSWFPSDPELDLFAGAYEPGGQSDHEGDFFRLDLTIDGLVNPPGRADPFTFDPFEYGDHPVYGFVEIDMVEVLGSERDGPDAFVRLIIIGAAQDGVHRQRRDHDERRQQDHQRRRRR